MRSKLNFLAAAFCLFLALSLLQSAHAQSLHERHDQIRAAIDSGNASAAIAQLQSLRATQPPIFGLNNYDYLLARLSERNGDLASASLNYESVITRRSVLAPYALWHLAQIARSSGDLVLE